MIEENPWPIEVLVEIFKWLSEEERLQQLASVQTLSPSRPYTKVLEDSWYQFRIYSFLTSAQDYKDRQPIEQQYRTMKGVLSFTDVVIALGQGGIPLRGNGDPSKRNEDGNFSFFVLNVRFVKCVLYTRLKG